MPHLSRPGITIHHYCSVLPPKKLLPCLIYKEGKMQEIMQDMSPSHCFPKGTWKGESQVLEEREKHSYQSLGHKNASK